jgi:hypothetical protein
MNVLDENVADEQRRLLARWKISCRQIGVEVGTKGMTDENIIPLLHALHRPTFFTRDVDFYRSGLRHDRYCLVWLDVGVADVAEYVRRFLRHPEFNSQAKRMGTVVGVAPSGLSIWRLREDRAVHSDWPAKKRN